MIAAQYLAAWQEIERSSRRGIHAHLQQGLLVSLDGSSSDDGWSKPRVMMR